MIGLWQPPGASTLFMTTKILCQMEATHHKSFLLTLGMIMYHYPELGIENPRMSRQSISKYLSRYMISQIK